MILYRLTERARDSQLLIDQEESIEDESERGAGASQQNNAYRYKDAAKTTPLRIFVAPSSNSFLSSIFPIAVAAVASCLKSSSSRRITRTMLPSKTSVNLPK